MSITSKCSISTAYYYLNVPQGSQEWAMLYWSGYSVTNNGRMVYSYNIPEELTSLLSNILCTQGTLQETEKGEKSEL